MLGAEQEMVNVPNTNEITRYSAPVPTSFIYYMLSDRKHYSYIYNGD